MERSIVVEEDHHRSNSTSVSKSMESFINIDSISIDLGSNNDKIDAGKCEHFSIRGYVSEVRKKDSKLCWPFALDGNHNNSEEQTYVLPPLHIPKFRWWCCQNCQSEIGAKGAAKELGMVFNCCHTGLKSNSHMSSLGNAALPLSDFQQTPKLDILEGRKVDVNASTNVNSIEYSTLLCDKNEKKTHISKTTIIGHENGLVDNVNREIPSLTGVAREVNSCLMQKRHTDSTVSETVLKSKCNGSVQYCELCCGSHDVSDADLAIANLKCMVKSSTESFQTGKENSADEQHMKVMRAFGTYGIASMVDEALDIVKDHTSGCPSLELDECDYASSESDDILVRNNVQDCHHNKPSGYHRRKTRKVRLLTELLGGNENANTDYIRIEDSPYNAVSVAPSGLDMHSIPQGLVAVHGNIRRGFMGQNRKRKFPQDEEWGPSEMNSLNNANKEVSTLEGDVENTTTNAGSEPEEDAISGIGTQTGMKSHWMTKCRVTRSPVLGKKYNKKTQVDYNCLSLAASQENMPKNICWKIGTANKGCVADSFLFKSLHDSSAGRGLDPLSLPAQRMGRKASLCKRKSKMPQVDIGQASRTPSKCDMLRKGPIMRKDVETMQNEPVAVSFQSAHNASTEKELHLSPKSYLAAQRNDWKYIPQVEDGLASLFSWQEGTPKGQVMRKDVETKYVGVSSVPSKSAPYAFSRKGVHCDPNGKTIYRVPFLNEKKNYISQVEDGDCSMMQQVDFSGTSNNEKTFQFREHSADMVKHSGQGADKVSEQGTLDDVPMEIVELMARNQYERYLNNAENNKHLIETTNSISNAETMNSTEMYGRELRFLEGNSYMKKYQARNGRNCAADKNVGPPTKQKAVDYFSHINRNHFHMSQTHAPMGFSVYSESQGKPSNRVQFSATGSNRHNSAQNCEWNDNSVGYGSCHFSLQALGACNTGQTAPQQIDKAAHLWSSVMSNNMPIGFNIPQKHAGKSTNVSMLSHCPSSLHRGKMIGDHDMEFLNLNPTNLEKHNRNFGSEPFSRTHVEYPFACKHNGLDLHQKLMGPLDLYSNETIPAMHLLSLMDAGMQSSSPINRDRTPEFLKKPSFPRDHYSKEFSGMEIGLYKTNETMKAPSSDFYSKSCLLGKSHEYFPVGPTVGSSASSFQNDRSFKKATAFTGQVLSKSRDKQKRKTSASVTKNKGSKSQKSVLTSGGISTNREAIPVHGMQKGYLGASDFMLFPSQIPTIENLTKHKFEAHSSNGAVWPLKSSLETEICSVNRNPADFSVPEAGNIYMIASEDLKFGKTLISKDRSGLINLNGHKQKKAMKFTTGKERARHLIL